MAERKMRIRTEETTENLTKPKRDALRVAM